MYLPITPRVDRVATAFLRKYGDSQLGALAELQQILMAERERGIRDAIVDVCAWLRMPDPEFDLSHPAAVQAAHVTAGCIEQLYLHGSRIARVLRGDSTVRS